MPVYSDVIHPILAYVFNVNTLAWDPMTQPGSGGAGGDVNVTNASLAVTGAFFQATQPVSLATAPTTPVTGTFWQSTQPVSLAAFPSASAATVTSVNDSATSVQLLAANAARKTATFFNDSTSLLYLKFGTTASTTDYTVKIAAGGYFELPLGAYTGRIDGIWSADSSGAVRITEY